MNQLNQAIAVALLLVSSNVFAGEFPAANFQPKIVYQDESVKNAAPASSGCQPTTTNAKTEAVEIDPKYPAANFQPKIVYSEAQ